MQGVNMTANGKTALLFPGQGSQFIGMGREFIEGDDEAKAVMDMAESVSGRPLGRICLEGPLEELTQSENLQPSLTAVNLICWQAFSKQSMKADFLAGHSLGEYSALCAAGVISTEDTLRLVTERGRLMGREGAANPGGMCAIVGLSLPQVEEIINGLASPGELSIGNHNSEKQVVISGTREKLKAASEIAVGRGAKAIALNVSIANHSPLMAGAVPDFEQFLEKTAFNKPALPVFFNATSGTEDDPGAIRSIMARQIVSTVRWYDIITGLIERGTTTFIEVGPKKVLSGLMRKILPRGGEHQCFQVDNPDSLNRLP
jgi:[acyl-carrier-protein] S-malonyltransferase